MVASGIEGVDFICANTDSQALQGANVRTALQIGCNITKGLGAGADPEVGRQAAMEDRDRIQEVIEGADMLFITAGLGGGTGTGAAPVVAQVARELGILTVAVVTKPFDMEGKKRQAVADMGIADLAKYVDSVITIPNEKLLTVLGSDTTLLEAFGSANEVLQNAVQGIAELITRPGLINVDFADVRTVMAEMGMAMREPAAPAARTARASRPSRRFPARCWKRSTCRAPAGSWSTLRRARTCRSASSSRSARTIKEYASDDATVVVGTVIDPEMTKNIRVTVVATGLGQPASVSQEPPMKVVTPPSREEKPNYSDFERPTRQRQQTGTEPLAQQAEMSMDFLDIPAFCASRRIERRSQHIC